MLHDYQVPSEWWGKPLQWPPLFSTEHPNPKSLLQLQSARGALCLRIYLTCILLGSWLLCTFRNKDSFLDGEAFCPNFVSAPPSMSVPSCFLFPSGTYLPHNCASNPPVAAPSLKLFESDSDPSSSEVTPVIEPASG
ncbi:hypothetical protein O181_014556 [Austropuccinia psidii MF-1]|uniref:Uncharacterized protein n=1 Tax=Austropuccinia psidii MF-1 TaxID=1389203 RepID=A0A9Q3BYB6_9BASI|nr:hypothetical protein [Austropuccinia psidii MF-1]